MSTLDLAATPTGGVGSRRLRTVVVMAFVALAIVAGTYVLGNLTGSQGIALTGDTSGPRPEVGQPVFDITATTTDGTAFSLAALKGQPVWLTFGGTWCVDCRTEAPDLQAAAAKYRPQGLQVVGVFVGETSAQVTEYAKRVGLDYTFVPDPTTRITSRFKTLGYPTHLFIGRDGIIKEIRIGGLRPDEMDRLAESILR